MADIQFKTVDTSKWEQLAPAKPAKAADKYTPILDALESGEIIQIETTDNKEAKGVRIALGRKASARGFKTEYRSEGNTLYARKSDEAATPTKSKKEKAAANV